MLENIVKARISHKNHSLTKGTLVTVKVHYLENFENES